ncbi:MAG: S9 family peptidase, partial [Sphingomonas sp.]
MRRTLLLLPLLLAIPATAQVAPETTASMPAIAYPQARRVDQVDVQFGVSVADPYRWLENDVRNDPEVRAWVDAENKVTDTYLETLPGRDHFNKRIKQLFDYERFGVPVRKGGHYFYQHNSGLQNQAVLFVRDSLDGPGRVLIDPNGWSKDGATALAEWLPSEDGKHLIYSVQDGGTDWRTLKVRDVKTGKDQADEIKWVKFSGLSWAKDGSGFYYSRFPAPTAGAAYQSRNTHHTIYFHRLGTKQAADRRIFATPDRPELNNFAQVSDDGRWLVISS